MNERERDFSTADLEDIMKEFSGGVPVDAGDEKFNTTDLLNTLKEVSEAPVSEPQPEPAEEASEEQAPAEEVPAEETPVEETPAEEAPAEEAPAGEPAAEEVPSAEVSEEAAPADDAAVQEDVETAAQEVTDAAASESDETDVQTEPVETDEQSEPEQSAEAEEVYENDEDEEEEVEITYLPPLIFRPKSRIRELKTKLVEGPERRYYELAEIGVGKLQLAMLICFVVVVLSGAGALLYNAGMVAENRMRLMIFSQVLAMLLGGLMGCQQMIEGISELFHGKFTLNTLLAFTFCACCVDSVFCLMEQRVPLCAAFTLEAALSLWGAYHKRTTEMGQMDTLRKAVRLDSLVCSPDYYEGRNGYLRGEGQVEDFMDHYDQVGGPEKLQRFYAFFSFLASIGIAVFAGLRHSVPMAFQILSTTMLVAVPVSMFVTLTRPEAVLERKLHSLGTVLCGWKNVKRLAARGVLPLRDQDLFPVGAVKMNGVKFYGDRNPEETIAYATALMSANGGSLAPIFEQLLTSRAGIRYQAVNVRHYGNGGIGGEVCGEPVLMGTLEFLKEMGVEIPEGTMVKQAVYVSIDGDLSGLFAINYVRTKFAASGIATLGGYRRVTPMVLARDFMLTAPFLKEKFGLRGRRTVFPSRQECDVLDQVQPAEDAPALALTTQEGLAPLAYAITGARALRTACRLGMVVHLIGGLLGLLIMLALAILGEAELLTPIHILLYQLVWMVPGLLVTLWPRTI